MPAPQPVAQDYAQPALPSVSVGWPFTSIDLQILTKSEGWQQNQTERFAEYNEIKNNGGAPSHVALAVPFDNLSKYQGYVNDARTSGFKVYHRSHWNYWQGDNGADSVSGSNASITHSGNVATCVTSGAHGLVTGQGVVISNATPVDYNGVFSVTVLNSTTFTYTMLSTPATNATVAGNWQNQLLLTAVGTTVTGKSVKPHGLYVGASIIIQGANTAAYNGRFTVTSVADIYTFTYTAGSAPGSSPDTGYGVLRYDRQTYLDKTYDFIVANPSLFAAGDLFGMCVESDQADGSSNPTFRTNGTFSTSFDFSLYNTFQKDQVRYANAAFAAISLNHKVHTWLISHGVSNLNLNGQTLSSGSMGNSNGLGDSDIATYFAGRLSIDHYEGTTLRDGVSYYNAYNPDLDKFAVAFPSINTQGGGLMISEWGYHTTTVTTDAEQLDVYSHVVTALQSKNFLIGVNFWNHAGQSQSSLWNLNGALIVAGGRAALQAVRTAFSSSNAYTVRFTLVTTLGTIWTQILGLMSSWVANAQLFGGVDGQLEGFPFGQTYSGSGAGSQLSSWGGTNLPVDPFTTPSLPQTTWTPPNMPTNQWR